MHALPAPRLLIAGQWVEAAGRATIPVIDPSEGEAFAKRVARGDTADVDAPL